MLPVEDRRACVEDAGSETPTRTDFFRVEHPRGRSLREKPLRGAGTQERKTNGTGSKVAPHQKPCEKMTEAMVMDGGRRGELVKVCADLSCRVHHPDTPSPEQVAKERAEERKRIEKNKQTITTRHCVLAKVLERVSAPLKKADLLTLAQYTIANLSYNQVPALAKRHKVETAKTTKPPQEVLMKKVSSYDEGELCRVLLEIGLLDSAYQRWGVSEDLLMDAAKRYRVDVEKIEKAVAAEFAAKKDKKTEPKVKSKAKAVARA
jgi:ParB family chromosome partitioning protein